MEKQLFMSVLEKSKTYNRATMAVVTRHVDYLRQLDDDGHLEFCAVTKKYPGVAGVIILRAGSYEEAKALCKAEPMGAEGLVNHKVSILEVANRENNYLL